MFAENHSSSCQSLNIASFRHCRAGTNCRHSILSATHAKTRVEIAGQRKNFFKVQRSMLQAGGLGVKKTTAQSV